MRHMLGYRVEEPVWEERGGKKYALGWRSRKDKIGNATENDQKEKLCVKRKGLVNLKKEESSSCRTG